MRRDIDSRAARALLVVLVLLDLAHSLYSLWRVRQREREWAEVGHRAARHIPAEPGPAAEETGQ